MTRALVAALIGVGLFVTLSVDAEEPPALNPFGAAATRDDALPGYCELSDGKLVFGQVYLTRDLRLKRSGDDGCGRQNWLINDLGWQDITEYPELGTVDIWRFIIDSGVSHPMHMPLVAFQILDRDGFTTGPGGVIDPNGNPQTPPAEERGWKDTAMVGPNQIQQAWPGRMAAKRRQ